MDNSEMSRNDSPGSAGSADSTEGKFSFRDLMKTAEEKTRSASARRIVPEELPAGVPDRTDVPAADQTVYELTDIIEESPARSITVSEFNTEIMKRVSEIAERVAREMFPEIAERIIREEIAKLKAADE